MITLLICVAVRVALSAAGGVFERAAESSGFRLLRQDVQVKFDWPPAEVQVRALLSICKEAEEPAWPQDRLSLILHPRARVEGVTTGDGTKLAYTRLWAVLLVNCPKTEGGWADLAGPEGTLKLTVDYKLVPGREAFGGGKDHLFLGLETWMPVLAPDDAYPVSLAVQCPCQVTLVGSGNRDKGETRNGSVPGNEAVQARAWTWEPPALARDIWLFASMDYAAVPDRSEDPHVCCIVAPGNEASAAHVAVLASSAVEYLEGALGPAGRRPYVFVQALLPDGDKQVSGRGGTGMAALSAKAWVDSQDPAENLSRDTLVIHELAHHWWGRTFRSSDRPGDPILVEGMAEYFAVRTMCEVPSAGGMRSMVARRRDKLAEYMASQGDPLALSRILRNSPDLRYLIYDKASAVIQMLEWYSGREAFDLACRRFLDDPGAHQGGLARFLELVGESSGRDLATFIERWFQKTGLPLLTGVEATVEEQTGGRTALRVTVSQESPGFPFVLPGLLVYPGSVQVPIELEIGAQSRSTQVIELPEGAGLPIQLRLDPNCLGAFLNRAAELSGLLNIKLGRP